MKIITAAIFAIILLLPVLSKSQDLYYGPESVAFDEQNNRYLISNYYNGTIVQVDSAGTQSYFMTGLGHCFGNLIKDNIFYVSITNSVMGIDLATNDTVMNIMLPHYGNLDGLAADTSGYLYVVDTGGRIIKVDISEQTYSIFVASGFPSYVQDIVFDELNNRLIAVAYAASSPIQAIDLSDSTVTNLVASYGYFDGVTRDQFGNTYVATHLGAGMIFRYNSVFSPEPVLISSGHNQPAGLDYNRRDNILAVPNFGGNTVNLISLEPTSIEENIIPDKQYISKSYPNPFNSTTTIHYYLPDAADVSIDIFDIIGRKVTSIINSNQPAGTHQETWNANSFSSGVYFYKLQAGDNLEIKQMVLLK